MKKIFFIHVYFCKQRVYGHTQPQIREILNTLLSTPPAPDFEIDNKISKKVPFFPKFQNNEVNSRKNITHLNVFPSSHIYYVILMYLTLLFCYFIYECCLIC